VLPLLCEALPPNMAIPAEAPQATMAALRRFPLKFPVVSSVCAGLRRMLEPRVNSEDPLREVERMVAIMKRDCSVKDLKKVLEDFPLAEPELQTNCLFVYSLLEGIPSVIEAMMDKSSSLQRRSAAVQALVDLFRAFRELLAPHAKAVREAAGVVAKQVELSDTPPPGREGEVSQEVLEIRSRCELLQGLLSHLNT